MKQAERECVGWREWVSLPLLGVERVLAKVDTGARSSCLHAFNVREISGGESPTIAFDIHPLHADDSLVIRCTSDLLEYRQIKSSNGEQEERPVVRVIMQLKGKQWPIDLTLTNRDAMGFRMLLGREAIRGRFVVDPGRSYLQGDPAIIDCDDNDDDDEEEEHDHDDA